MDSTDNFSFSIKAQNVEAQFYNKKAIVYVEGDDDLLFWRQHFPDSYFEIKKVDGCKNLEKKIYEIENSGLKCIVACDSDYKSFEEGYKTHPLVVHTLSHSIECMMYCPVNLNECIKKLSRSLEDKTNDIIRCYTQFGDEIKELIAYDIANNIYKLGIKVTGDSCSRFLMSSQSCRIDTSKVSKFLEQLRPSFEGVDMRRIIHLIDKDSRNMRQITKGHFQTTFVINMIKEIAKKTTNTKKTLSDDVLYALLINCPSSCSHKCIEKNVIKSRIELALKFLKVA